MDNKKSKYTPIELKEALDLIEEGSSISEASSDTNLNKSILAREMRKRKNQKALQDIKEFQKNLYN
jgi:hypothetical protein